MLAPAPNLRRVAAALAVGLFHAIATSIILGDVLAGKSTFLFNHDACFQTFPWLTKIFDAVRHGQIPLWSFGTIGGISFVGEVQPGALYPVAWIAGLLATPGDPYGVDLFIVFHFWLAAVAMHGLARGAGLGHFGAALGALAFAFASGVGLRATAQPNLFASLAYLPLVALGALRAINAGSALPRLCWSAAGAVALSLSLLAGHAYPPIHAMTAAVVAMAVVGASTGRGWRVTTREAALIVAAMTILAAILAAPQIYAAQEYFARSYRWYGPDFTRPGHHTVPYAEVAKAALQLRSLPTAWTAAEIDSPDGGTLFFTRTGLLAGIVGLLLAWKQGAWRSPRMLVGPAILLVGLFLALAMQGPFGRILHAIPILNIVRQPVRHLFVFALGASFFAAAGSDALLSKLSGRSKLLGILAGVALVALSMAECRQLMDQRLASVQDPRYPATSVYRDPLIREIARLSAEAQLRYRVYLPEKYANPNVGDVLPILSTSGFRSSQTARYFDYFDYNPRSERMDLLAVRWWVSDKPIEGLPPVASIGSISIYERRSALPIFWLVRPDGSRVPAPIESLSYRQNSVTANLLEPALGTLVFSQASYPGWRALTADGDRPVGSYDAFMATDLRTPTRVVTFAYRPRWFMPLGILAILGLFVVATIGAAGLLQRARTREKGPLPVAGNVGGSEAGAGTPVQQQIGEVGYENRVQQQIDQYVNVENIHDLPAIFHYWSNRYLLPRLQAIAQVDSVPKFYADAVLNASTGGSPVEIVSLGAGDAQVEISVAKHLLDRGFETFRLTCLEMSPVLVARAVENARRCEVGRWISVVQQDLNEWSPPASSVDVAMAHHSLHHMLNLERIFDHVSAMLRPGAIFVTNDVIGRNGHMRWPEVKAWIDAIWPMLPERIKVNRQLRRTEHEFLDWDCSTEGFEGIRAQDILPLLRARFDFDLFFAYGGLIDIFIERSFGPNLSADDPTDRALIDFLAQLNDRLIDLGDIKPTGMYARMRPKGAEPAPTPRVYRTWTPEWSMRPC